MLKEYPVVGEERPVRIHSRATLKKRTPLQEERNERGRTTGLEEHVINTWFEKRISVEMKK